MGKAVAATEEEKDRGRGRGRHEERRRSGQKNPSARKIKTFTNMKKTVKRKGVAKSRLQFEKKTASSLNPDSLSILYPFSGRAKESGLLRIDENIIRIFNFQSVRPAHMMMMMTLKEVRPTVVRGLALQA